MRPTYREHEKKKSELFVYLSLFEQWRSFTQIYLASMCCFYLALCSHSLAEFLRVVVIEAHASRNMVGEGSNEFLACSSRSMDHVTCPLPRPEFTRDGNSLLKCFVMNFPHIHLSPSHFEIVSKQSCTPPFLCFGNHVRGVSFSS